MKLHRNLVAAVTQALSEIIFDGSHAEQVVEALLISNKSWGARDRHFIAENIYEIVRNQRWLAHCAQSSNPYFLLATRLKLQGIELPEWEEFKGFALNFPIEKAERKIELSIPDWLDDFGVKELGENTWQREMQAMHTTAKVCLRANTLKTTFENCISQLEAENIEFETVGNTIVLSGRRNIKSTKAYQNGLVEIQDFNSQKIVPLLQAEPCEIVIDACAGAGGKTLHLAAEMKNKGKIYALDIFENKLKELNKRAQRAGAKNITTAEANATIFAQLENKADKLLLDVPCSGSGVFRRKPDSKFKLSETQLTELQNLQWKILSTYHNMLKPGGTMLYVTCSIFPSENEKQIERFLNEFGDKFQLKSTLNFSPAQTGFDGFFAALLTKIL